MNDLPILQAQSLSKSYGHGDKKTDVLKNLSIDIYKGDDICLLGPSGAGKSTLLNILGSLDDPTAGTVFFKGTPLPYGNDHKLAEFRNKSLGFVFQFHNLIAELSALENVMMPCLIAGQPLSEAEDRAAQLLKALGLGERVTHRPSEMSGGECQRVAVARALVRHPEILMADEPTGNLDTKNRRAIQQLFFQLKRELDLTLVVVTHDLSFSQQFSRRYILEDGAWAEDRTDFSALF